MAQSSTLRVCSAVPGLAPWEPSDRVTVMGDAVHAMSPCGGVGAATAFRDAAALAGILGEEGVSREGVGRYEEGMRGYARGAVERSFMGGKKMFGQRPFGECRAVDF